MAFFKPALTTEAGPIICAQCDSAISRPWRELGTGVAQGSAAAVLLIALFDSEPFGLEGIIGLMIFAASASFLYLLMISAVAYYAFPLSPIRNEATAPSLIPIRPRRLIHLLMVAIIGGALQTLFNTYLTTIFFAIGFALTAVLSINRNVWQARILPIACYAVGLGIVPWGEVSNFFNDAEKSKQFCEQLQWGTMRADVMQGAEANGLTYTEKTPYLIAGISRGDGPTNCHVYYLNSKVLRTEQRYRR